MQKMIYTASLIVVTAGAPCSLAVAEDPCYPFFENESVNTFLPLPIDDDLRSMEIVDLNGDDYPDMVVAGSGLAYLLEGLGDGSFSTIGVIPSGAGAIALADVNGDEIDDLITYGSDLFINYGFGEYMFSAPVGIGLGHTNPLIYLSDVDNDSILDIQVAALGSLATVFGYNGFGVHPVTIAEGIGGTSGRSWALEDVDKDGINDVISDTTGFPNIARVFFGNSDGTFTLIESDIPGFDNEFIGDHSIVFPLSADLRLGHLLMTGGGGLGFLGFYAINFDGTKQLLLETEATSAYDHDTLRFTIADVDGDGSEDIFALANFDYPAGSGLVAVRQRKNGGFFGVAAEPLAGLDNGIISRPVVADFNGDGRPDLAVCRNPIRVYLNALEFCDADLDFNCILDLSDIGSFTNGFLSGDPSSDLNSDSILDLMDIAQFIDSFTSCDG